MSLSFLFRYLTLTGAAPVPSITSNLNWFREEKPFVNLKPKQANFEGSVMALNGVFYQNIKRESSR